MHTLTTEQQATLVEIINEQFGSHLEFDDFADAMLGLFEDIPGFETFRAPARASRYVRQLWRSYHGLSRPKSPSSPLPL